jgi:hypothetical protein
MCKLEKSEIEFVWKNMALGIRLQVCKECQREKSKKHYHANKQAYVNRKKMYVKEVQLKVREFKTMKGCFDCGETDFRCLDFDHIDPKTKIGNVSTLAYGWSYEKLLSEMEKCQVRCSNCHRKRTFDLMES